MESLPCYTKKQYKQNEAIYHYNADRTIEKIVDNFRTFNSQYYYYLYNELSKIVVRDKNGKLIDEILISCEAKDKKGTCLKEIRNSMITNNKEEILFTPVY